MAINGVIGGDESEMHVTGAQTLYYLFGALAFLLSARQVPSWARRLGLYAQGRRALILKLDVATMEARLAKMEALSATTAADGWRRAAEASRLDHEALVKRVDGVEARLGAIQTKLAAALRYTRSVVTHALLIEGEAAAAGISLSRKLPPVPPDLMDDITIPL